MKAETEKKKQPLVFCFINSSNNVHWWFMPTFKYV